MPSQKLNYYEALTHFIKVMMCLGIFSMGSAYKIVGNIVAIPLSVLVLVVVAHCQHLLLQSGEFVEAELIREVETERRPRKASVAAIRPQTHIYEHPEEEIEIDHEGVARLNYAYVVEFIFKMGNPIFRKSTDVMRCIVNVSTCSLHIGMCAVFQVFIASNISKVLADYDIWISAGVLKVIFIIPLWLISMVPNLRLLTPFSIMANSMQFVAIALVFLHMAKDMPPFDTTVNSSSLQGLPQFFCMNLLAFEGISVILPLRIQMEDAKMLSRKLGVINVGFFIVGTLAIAMGAVTYQKYGQDLQDGVTLKLPDQKIADVVTVFMCITLIATFPIHVQIVSSVIWPAIDKSKGPFHNPKCAELTCRSVLLLLTLLIAETVPQLDIIFSFVANMCSPALTLYVPPMLEVVRRYNELHGCGKLIIVKDMFLVGFSILVFITGLYTSSKVIYSDAMDEYG